MGMSLEIAKKELAATRPTFDQLNLNQLDFNKEMEFAIQIFQNNSYLLTCEPDTVRNCLINVALTGTTLNPVLKQAYLVPRGKKCCLDMSYIGLIKIITDTGSVKHIKSGVVYEKEFFDIELGSGGYVKHKPFLGTGGNGRRIGAYSVATLHDGTFHVDFMYEAELMNIKSRSEGVKSGKNSPWLSDENQMICKTVIKRHWKFLPKSERALMAANAIDIDHENNGIDFKKEKEQKENAQYTQTVPADIELASDEDMTTICTLLDNELFGDVITTAKHPNGFKKAVFKENITKQFDAGVYPKDKATITITFLTEELKKREDAATAGEGVDEPAATEEVVAKPDVDLTAETEEEEGDFK